MSAGCENGSATVPEDAGVQEAMKDLEKGLRSGKDDCATLLYDAVNVSMIVSKFEKTDTKPFLPQDAFERIWSTIAGDEKSRCDNILKLMDIQLNGSNEDDRELANYILKSAKKIFLVAIWMGVDQLRAAMKLFQIFQFEDENLPIKEWTGTKFKLAPGDHQFVRMEESRGNNRKRIWNLRTITDFQVGQWIFLAPTISTSDQNRSFGNGYPIPFITRDEKRSSGAHGIVYKYGIHPAHFMSLPDSVSESCYLRLYSQAYDIP